MSDVLRSALGALRLSGQVQVALRRLLSRLVEEQRSPSLSRECGEQTGASGLVQEMTRVISQAFLIH